MSGYDVIGDIHGHADKLVGLLREMGYEQRSGAWRHAERTAVFVGDLIDRGLQQRESIGIPRAMVEAGSAHMVLGNHEFNAIAYAQWSEERGDYCRSRLGESGKKHIDQHAAFINQIGRHCCVGGSGGGVACFGGSSGSVVLTDRVRVVACPGDFSSPCCISIVRWIPVPARRDLAGSALVSPLRPVLPRCRRTPGRTRHRSRSRHRVPVGATLHPAGHRGGTAVPAQCRRSLVRRRNLRPRRWRVAVRVPSCRPTRPGHRRAGVEAAQHTGCDQVLRDNAGGTRPAKRGHHGPRCTVAPRGRRPPSGGAARHEPICEQPDRVRSRTAQGTVAADARPMRGRCAACERIGPRRS
jgi:hypothetical protein